MRQEAVPVNYIRLRTMTERSTLSGGKHAGETVGEVMMTDKTYLIFLYYRYEHLSFTDDVLNLIGISEDYRIAKPGFDEEMFIRFKKAKSAEFYASIEDEELRNRLRMGRVNHIRAVIRKRKARRLHNAEAMEKRLTNKARLAWKNQGH